MNAALLGVAIRGYRLRRRQIHNGKPWTLDDLAVATDDDKAHLSRIERGSILPNRATLLRIAAALELARPETEFLLRLAGFAPLLDTPGPEAAEAAVRWLARQSRAYLNPFTLYALDMRVWYTNALWLRLMGMTPARFRTCMVGHDLTDSYVAHCSTTDLVHSRYRNHAELEQRSVIRCRTAAIDGLLPQERVNELLRNDKFRAMWEAGESRIAQSCLSGQQAYSEVDYPGRGILRFDTWWCPLQIDPRFLVILHIPHDVYTREAVTEIRRDPRPEPGEPCLFHGYGCGNATHHGHAAAAAVSRAKPAGLHAGH
ncbi:MAG TPA: helix-turn-helix transcriptional regulator [Burkholderiales bacterium]|nr:helix-turn-helix transcriptional regulator [Burkholderiales bacterium]